MPICLEATPTAPFCSDRCRLIDLGRWLEESYTVPAPVSDNDEEEMLADMPPELFSNDGDEA